MEFTYFECTKGQDGGSSMVYLGPQRSRNVSPRFAPVLREFHGSYLRAFPGAVPARIGLIVEPRNGASGSWTVAEPKLGPIFVIEIDPELVEAEHIFAHELMHPVLRLRGVPIGKSLGAIDRSIGDEFTSTAHHPFVFDALDQYGYLSEHQEDYVICARSELEKLKNADFSSVWFTESPGQTWMAFWYFNFYLLARPEYEAIYALHSTRAPSIAQKMDLVRQSWLSATKGRGVIKRNASSQCIRAFQSNLMKTLDLEGRIALQSLSAWGDWLFQLCPRS